MARGLILVVGLLIVGFALTWLATGRKVWLQWSVRLFLVSLVAGLLFFIGLFISRL